VWRFAGRDAVVAIARLVAGLTVWLRIEAELETLLLLSSGLVAMLMTVIVCCVYVCIVGVMFSRFVIEIVLRLAGCPGSSPLALPHLLSEKDIH